jgi:curli biogenesis system outer membrane secretion channel CsgG
MSSKKINMIWSFTIIVLLIVSFGDNVTVVQGQTSNVKSGSSASTSASSLKRKVAIARFSNETQYGKGLFYDKENDPLGKQAVDILSAKLAATDKFILLERQDIDRVYEELQISTDAANQKVGADYLIIGSLTEFGRKNSGDVKLLSKSKTQIVEAGVSVRLVDVSTGQIIYSEEAKGEAETTDKVVLGLGERTGFDATLSDKAISAAISKLVENIVNNCMDRPWKAFFLAIDDDAIIMSGGKSQGLSVGDMFNVIERGRVVKNPQTGINIELPGKIVGKVRIVMMGGDNTMNEYSIVEFIGAKIDPSDINKYIIQEIGE